VDWLAKFLMFSAVAGLIGSGQEVPRKLPGHVKLVNGFVQSRDAGASGTVRREVKNLLPAKEKETAAMRCAHIITHVPHPKVDPEFTMQTPDTKRWRMPVHKGLPVCAEDVRQLRAPSPR
jgi:hypothetical protein